MNHRTDDKLGIYISIPFCRSKCTYCNFASGVYPASEHTRYVDRLIEDLSWTNEWAARTHAEIPRAVDTVYLGGGTPSLLAPDLIQRLFGAVRAHFDVAPDAEITAECAPGQIANDVLDAMISVGVNRVSLGVQSFIDREAQLSGRLHNRETVLRDLDRLRKAGIANLNMDLIAGLAGQTFESWKESLAVLIDSEVPHASIYMLEVDEDSRLGREMLVGGTRYHAGLVPSDDAMTQMYTSAIDQLAQVGLQQYEISNFSRPGFQSQHNLRYWHRRPYLGLGLDASSALYGQRGALRFTTMSELPGFLAGPSEPVELSWQAAEQQHEEAWFLGLRLNQGVEPAAIEREFGPDAAQRAIDAVAGLVQKGLLIFENKRVRLTELGRLLSNDVFQEFLDLRDTGLNAEESDLLQVRNG